MKIDPPLRVHRVARTELVALSIRWKFRTSCQEGAMVIHSREQLLHLVPEFTALPAETEWLEFKVNNTDPEMIGERVSALANSARIAGRDFGYLIWGVEDGTHKIVGTDFEPAVARKGNEPLESWMARMVHPQVHFEFEAV